LLRFLHRHGQPTTQAERVSPADDKLRAMRVVWVFFAGGLGSVARFGVGVASAGAFGTTLLPLGTLAVNLVGSFLIAALAELALTGRVSPELRLVLATGFLGGFTTYSAFANESFTYLRDGLLGFGLGYIALTVVGCLVMCLLGQLAARAFLAS
jgi:fluoride exporter